LQPNGWHISRRRVRQRPHQLKAHHLTKTGNNGMLDQVVAWMCGPGSHD